MSYALDASVRDLAAAVGHDLGEINKNTRKITTDEARAPLATDDSVAGYGVGSRWIFQGQEWVAIDVTPGVARWLRAAASFDATFAAPMNGSDDDAPALQFAFDLANAVGLRDVRIPGSPTIKSALSLHGGTNYQFGGPVTWAGTSGNAFEIVDNGGYQERGRVSGLRLVGNDLADAGMVLTAARYWTFADMEISGFTKPGAYGLVLTGTADNRNTSSNVFINCQVENCDNLLLLGKNPAIPGSVNTGSSFNTFIGGFWGPFGDNTSTVQYGINVDVGEANKFVNVRVSTQRQYTRCWHINDSRTQMIGCAGDGPCFTAFVYPLAGTSGTVDSITLLGVPVLETPVAWAGSRSATADAIVAQIVADGNQYPATEFKAVSWQGQVHFYRVESGVDTRVATGEISGISVTKTGDITVGDSSINQGLLQGAPYTNFPDVTANKWGYQTGHGGVRETYGFYFDAGATGSLYEPEGNGPEHIVWFVDANKQRSVNVWQQAMTVHGEAFLTTDAVFRNQDGNIRAAFDPPANVSVSHATQMLRTQNFGPMVHSHFDLQFTPTITGAGFFYVEFPQLAGVRATTKPLDMTGMFFRIPVTVTGLTGAAAGKACMLVIYGNATSPAGVPYGRLEMADSATIIGTAHMTSGTPVRIRGWGQWPVDRFG